MDEPTSRTSNYGWALWHLHMAQKAGSADGALVHATCAQARATLAAVDEHGGCDTRSTWDEEPSDA